MNNLAPTIFNTLLIFHLAYVPKLSTMFRQSSAPDTPVLPPPHLDGCFIQVKEERLVGKLDPECAFCLLQPPHLVFSPEHREGGKCGPLHLASSPLYQSHWPEVWPLTSWAGCTKQLKKLSPGKGEKQCFIYFIK